jgi:hypothetical protein
MGLAWGGLLDQLVREVMLRCMKHKMWLTEREKIYQDPGAEVVQRGDDAVSLTDSAVDSRDSAWARHASATTRSHSQPSTPAQHPSQHSAQAPHTVAAAR